MMIRNQIKNNFEYILFLSLSRWLRSQSTDRAVAFHLKLAKLWFDILKIRREETIKNLRFTFPEKTETELSSLARRIFVHFSRVSVEHILMPKFCQQGFKGIVGSANWQLLDEVYDRGKGVVVITGHFGNWELLGTLISNRGYHTAAIAAGMRNEKVDRLINEHRRLTGGQIIYKEDAKTEIPKFLKQGGLIFLLSDQDAGKTGVFVPFLGRPASTAIGPAIFVLRNHVPFVYATAIYQNGKYHLHFEELPVPAVAKNLRETVYRLTEIHTKRLEKDILKYPEQWFWLHRRWKTTPERGTDGV